MAQTDTSNMAIFCDFENVALGVRDAKYQRFNIELILEKLLLKGSIVVKKAYCDWDRYKEFKAPMHGAAFELIEIPHLRQSGKNSADIRMVVDALDLCYTKEHVDTFVIVSGDSDFSPLVSKLRENNKRVIGVGVKNSTSDLLTANCDEFIFYDDLVRPKKKKQKKATSPNPTKAAAPKKKEAPLDKAEERKQKGFALVLKTLDALSEDRSGEDDKIWGSMVKQTIKRRQPGFHESYHGFSGFGDLLDEMVERGLITVERDGPSGGHIIKEWNSEDEAG